MLPGKVVCNSVQFARDMVSLKSTVVGKDIGEYLFQLSGTCVNLRKKLVQHVHSGHVITENADKHLRETCSIDGFAHRAQF